MFWAILIIMLLVATVVVVWPQYRSTATITPTTIAAAIVVIAVSVGLYMRIGTPDAQQQLATVASVEDMVASLAAKLEKNPDDNEGWKMLGRSYLQMGDMPGAISSFEKAVELEGGNNGETLVALGEAMLMQDRASMAGKAGQLFESGLALAPSSPQGLFFGGLAALQRGDQILAAARWEALLDLNPPEEIRGVLEQRIAEWRGESQPAPQPVAVAAAVVEIDVTLSEFLWLEEERSWV